MPWGLKRFQHADCLHFITFSCYHREPLLAAPQARELFEVELERVRRWYRFYVSAYVVMPEHVHLMVSEPERKQLSVAIQMLKQIVSRKLRRKGERQFWQTRYYDYLVPSEKKRQEKLHYIHQNPVKRGLVQRPDDWKWSSFLHIATGREGTVEIESQWTARKRELMGNPLQVVRRQEQPHPVALLRLRSGQASSRATRLWQPQK
jgi:putative transposase